MEINFGGKIVVNLLPKMLPNEFFDGWKSAVIPTILNFESLMAVREGFEPSIQHKVV